MVSILKYTYSIDQHANIQEKEGYFSSNFIGCGKSMLMSLIYRLNILQDNIRYQLELPFSSKYTAFNAIPSATPIQKNSTQTTFCQREFVRDIRMLSFLSALDQETALVCYIHKYTDSQEINGDETVHLSFL
jgi:hypothetical protein